MPDNPIPSSADLRLPSPAKLNLFLHIIGRRDDGYHSLQTLFQFLDYGDELGFSLRQDDRIQLHGQLPGVPQQDNLIVKAAHLLQQHTGTGLGADVWLKKRLPMGGGLGGGSSNAATTLLALDRLWATDCDQETLARVGLHLGADVPVFVRGRAAFGESVGEILHPMNPPELWRLVIIPEIQVNTAEVFSAPELTRNSTPIKVRDVLEQSGRNDCQNVVLQRYPQVHDALALLDSFAPAQMTGTGGCVFASFANQAEAEHVEAQLPATTRRFVARSSNISALHRKLENLGTRGS